MVGTAKSYSQVSTALLQNQIIRSYPFKLFAQNKLPFPPHNLQQKLLQKIKPVLKA